MVEREIDLVLGSVSGDRNDGDCHEILSAVFDGDR